MGAVCREVICIQLGQYANCVGAHWWNLQETQCSRWPDSELCSNVQFRTGITQNGVETYTPRLIVLDINDGVRSVQATGALYDDEKTAQATPAWRGKLTTHKEDPTECIGGAATQGGGAPNYGGGREMVAGGGGAILYNRGASRQPIPRDGVWSDYLRTPLHPKSLCMLSHRNHGGVTGGLESFSQGESLLKAASHLEEVEDRLRFFSEECDYLQGFHILCDTHNGFSGAGAKMAELIHDEYPGRGILSFGTSPVLSEQRDLHTSMYQLMNCVMSLVALTNHSSVFCPLSLNSSFGRKPGPPVIFPQLLYDASWQYHSSAVLAVALDTLTAPYRLTSSTLSMSQLTDTISFGGRKMLTASCSLPFPFGSSSLPDGLLPHMASPPWRCLSACTDDTPVFSQSVVLRGIPGQQQIGSLPARTRPPSSLHACASGEEVLQCYLSAACPRTLSVSHLLGSPCTLGPTFPQFFSRYITRDGYTMEEPLTDSTVVDGVPVMAALRTSSALRLSLRALCDEVTKMDLRRCANYSTAGIEEEEFKEVISDLRSLAHCYQVYEGEVSDDSD
ncbi:PREDICTED: protein misato homolog 1 [Nanorana parkeri]|uniref:protein misato homolog 1 n=1 Tax=Nanorana parkeri TaxID=125878 RepID=UPI00085442BE|nr:PREDICTED: protein misato homolog 1 [Nanorana parkeri]